MAGRFVPVPYAALEGLPPSHWRPAVDLYRRGHVLRWQWFAVTERSLATSWGCSTRQVRAVLETMAALGLAEIVPGKRAVPTRIRVADPVASSQQAEPHRKRDHSESESQGVADRVAILSEPELEPEENNPPSPPRGGGLFEGEQEAPPTKPKKRRKRAPVIITSDIRAVWDCYRHQALTADRGRRKAGSLWHPGCGEDPPQPVAKVVAAALEAYPVEALVRVVEWAHKSPDRRAEHLRGGYLGLDNLTRMDSLPGKVDAASQWSEGGAELVAADYSAEGKAAFDHVCALLSRHGQRGFPQRLHPDEGKNTASVAAMRAVGLGNIGRATSFELKGLCEQFVAAYSAARGGG